MYWPLMDGWKGTALSHRKENTKGKLKEIGGHVAAQAPGN
jgi:hypothetical protein